MVVPPGGAEVRGADRLLTVDQLAAAAGTTVRTTRYYASLGLLPAPLRRGRLAYYGPQHLARLELVRALQDHGLTLAAIERYLADLPTGISAEDLAVQRALLTAWRPAQWEEVSREELEARAGRRLTDEALEWLRRAGAVHRTETGYQVLPDLGQALEVLDEGVPFEAIAEANAAVRRHMTELADELTEVLHRHVISGYQNAGTPASTERLERTVSNLRTLTLDALVTGFQRAVSHVVARSLTLRGDDPAQ